LIRDLKQQVRDRIKKAKDNQISSVGETLNKKLGEVEGKIYQVHLRSQLDALNHPIMLNNRLANLQLSIETGGGRPTSQAYDAFQKLSSEFDVLLGKLNDAFKTEAARFNKLLADRKLEPVKTSR
jgi:YD repeat-containing protein